MLKGKNILLGVCGSIAAYKAALLVRLFVKEGANVQVICSPDAKDFITPLTLATLSKRPVYVDFVKDEQTGVWTNHVELGLWADVFVIAPATANTIAKFAHGLCDNLLSATYLSARCPVFLAPAMDLDMWMHPATQMNIETLKNFGNKIIDVEEGELASGLEGKGRMAEPEHIFSLLKEYFNVSVKNSFFTNKKILITAGPTQEHIDPIRFITNHSSGTMGVELANAFATQGASVTLVLGPTTKTFTFHKNIKVIHSISAEDMFTEVDKTFDSADITVMAAAVADYTPISTADHKLKKQPDDMSLPLKRTKDILATMGKRKKSHQLLIGFALETNNELQNAKNKLQKKNLDFIVLNSLRDKGAGFKHPTNQITIIDKYNNITKFELKNKSQVSLDILEYIKSFPHAISV